MDSWWDNEKYILGLETLAIHYIDSMEYDIVMTYIHPSHIFTESLVLQQKIVLPNNVNLSFVLI